jgi:adenylate kinase family enzyme
MKRVLVIGHPGAGKTTFAVELGKKLNLPVIYLDQQFWQPGWVKTPMDIFRERVVTFASADAWLMDGTYDSTLDLRLPHADAVIWLDYSRYLCLWQAIKRIARNYGTVREKMADGCPEKIDFGFFRWIWNYQRNQYPGIRALIRKHFVGEPIILRNHVEAERWLADLSS